MESIQGQRPAPKINDGSFYNFQNPKFLSAHAIGFFLRNLSLTKTYIRIMRQQYKAHLLRKKHSENGLKVPPILMLTITAKCNLNCTGCYQKSIDHEKHKELTDEKITSILQEARELGTTFVFILGGEPFMRDLISLTKPFGDMTFLVYTNGTLLNSDVINQIKKQPQIIPLISLEGEKETENRRGAGVYQNALEVFRQLKKRKIFFGLSVTVTRNNFREVCNNEYIKEMVKRGNKVFSFFEYLPFKESTSEMTLTEEQKRLYFDFIYNFRKKHNQLILSSAIEQFHGGCMGAGNGLFHINYNGQVEPCPFAPFSDISIHNHSFKQCLESPLFKKIQKNHMWLENRKKCHSCTLFYNRDIIKRFEIEGMAEVQSKEVSSLKEVEVRK